MHYSIFTILKISVLFYPLYRELSKKNKNVLRTTGNPVVDSVLGGFSEGLVRSAKRPLYDDHYVGTYTKIESNLCFLRVCVIVKI